MAHRIRPANWHSCCSFESVRFAMKDKASTDSLLQQPDPVFIEAPPAELHQKDLEESARIPDDDYADCGSLLETCGEQFALERYLYGRNRF